MDFAYDINFSFSFNIRPQSLISLLEAQKITDQTSLKEYENHTGDNVEAFFQQRLGIHFEDERKIEEMLASASIAQLEKEVLTAFPHIENFSFTILTTNFPDFTLYRQFRSMYNDYVTRIMEFMHNDALFMPENRVASFFRFDELSRYGELLTRFPILLDFLALEKSGP